MRIALFYMHKHSKKKNKKNIGFVVLPCTGVTEVCARRMWCSVMWYAGWCWAISTLVHTLLSPWRKKEKEHDRCSLRRDDSEDSDDGIRDERKQRRNVPARSLNVSTCV